LSVSVAYSSSCVALHVPQRPDTLQSSNRLYGISSDLEVAASGLSPVETRFSGSLTVTLESSFPIIVGKAQARGEARRGNEERGTRTKVRGGRISRYLAALCLLGLYLHNCGGSGMEMGRILISARAKANVSVAYSSSCVALHVPQRQYTLQSSNRLYGISSDLEVAASGLSPVVSRFSGSLTAYRALAWG